MNGDDRLLLYGDPETIQTVLQKFELPLVRKNGNMSLGEETQSMSPSKPKKQPRATLVNVTPSVNAYQPIFAKSQRHLVQEQSYEPKQAKNRRSSAPIMEEKESGHFGEVELPPKSKPENSDGGQDAEGKGWGARLGTRVHPVQKYLTGKLSKSRSRSDSPPRSRDTDDLKELTDVGKMFDDNEKDKSV